MIFSFFGTVNYHKGMGKANIRKKCLTGEESAEAISIISIRDSFPLNTQRYLEGAPLEK
jgi:hypothetical protein